MNPAFALRRSIIFWAGLLMIAFTCWAWWDSCRNVSFIQGKQVRAQSGNHGITISREVGINFAIGGTRSATHPAPDRYRPPFLVLSQGKPFEPKDTPTLKEFYQFTINGLPRGSWVLHLPYWLIVFALPVPWVLLLLWRSRRSKRAGLPVST